MMFAAKCLMATIISVAPGVLPMNNTNDLRALNRAKIGCGEFYPKSPCLKKFTKVKEHGYEGVCGK